MPHRATLLALAVCLSAAAASAQIVRPVAPLGPSTSINAAGAQGQALISGKAVDVNTTPLPNATVRLRNLLNNQIEHVTTANPLGEFSFVARPEVPYVIEIADVTGRVVAVGDVVIAQAGDVAAAVVSLPSRLPALAGVFTDTAGSVASAAASTGVTVVPQLPPLSADK